MRARSMEKDIRKEIMKSKEIKIRSEASLGSANLWKAVRIANDSQQEDYPDLTNNDGKWAYSNMDKAEMFAEEFERKIKDITTMVRPDRDQWREKKEDT